MLIRNIFLCLITFGMMARAQQDDGPKLGAMGGNTAAVADIWNVLGNPGLLTKNITTTVGIQYLNYIPGQQLNSKGLAIVIPINRTTVAFGSRRYGIDEFNELKLSGVVARKFGKSLSFGFRANYHQLKIANYGSKGIPTIDIGMSYQVSDKLLMGGFINNPINMQFYDKTLSEKIPIQATFGISYQIADHVLVAACFIDESNRSAFRLGLAYEVLACLTARTGISSNPLSTHGGFGLKWKHFEFDIAITANPFSSYTPQLGISYAF